MKRLLTAASALGAAPVAYLLALVTAAARAGGARPPSSSSGPRFTVLVPAHDEEAGIGATVESLSAMRYAPGFEVVVIADNCTDATAGVARASGATVWERDEPHLRGKGAALAWAVPRVGPDAVVVVDADCTVSPNLLEALGGRLAAGARAAQASYVVANPEESPAAAARFAGFALVNHVRPLGKSALGLSAGLLGSGMAFERELLEAIPWSASAMTEDAEYHLRLARAGIRVEFVPEARVESPMPVSLDAAESQRERWESGSATLATRAPDLVMSGLRDRDLGRVHAGVELLVPPQSLLMAANAALFAAALALRARPAARLSAAALAGQVGFVVAGLALVRAPSAVYRSLAMAPLLVVRNARLYRRLARGERPHGWVRTTR